MFWTCSLLVKILEESLSDTSVFCAWNGTSWRVITSLCSYECWASLTSCLIGFIVSLPGHFNLHITILLPFLRHLQVLKNLIFSSNKNTVLLKVHVLLEQHAYVSAAFLSTCDRRHISSILCRAFLWTLRCVNFFVPPLGLNKITTAIFLQLQGQRNKFHHT